MSIKITKNSLSTKKTKVALKKEQKMITRITLAANRLNYSMSECVDAAIDLGEELIKAKSLVPFGQWEPFIKAHFEFAFSERQAQKYMQIAKNKTLLLDVLDGEFLTIDSLTKAIANASPEQFKMADELKRIEAEEKNTTIEKANIETKNSVKPTIKTITPISNAIVYDLKELETKLPKPFLHDKHQSDNLKKSTGILLFVAKEKSQTAPVEIPESQITKLENRLRQEHQRNEDLQRKLDSMRALSRLTSSQQTLLSDRTDDELVKELERRGFEVSIYKEVLSKNSK